MLSITKYMSLFKEYGGYLQGVISIYSNQNNNNNNFLCHYYYHW